MGDGRNDKERTRKYDTRKSKIAYAISKETGVAENTAKRYIDRPVTQSPSSVSLHVFHNN